MRKQSIARTVALVSLATMLGACGTAAPAPNNTGTASGSHSSKTGSGAGNNGSSSSKKGSNTSQNGSNTGKTKTKTKTMAAGKSGTKRGRMAKRRMVANAKPISLATLPTATAIAPFNPHFHAYHVISTFIPGMGYHWQTPVPGIVYMTNQHNQLTGVEAAFPQNHGYQGWYDPATPTTVPNGSLAFYTEHLYFVPSSSIVPSMSAAISPNLSSWASFVAANPRLHSYIKEPGLFRGYTVYGPPTGPGIKVLVSPAGLISGFLVSEPAPWGWHPGYVGMKGKPFMSKVYGKAYYSVLMLEPPMAPGAKS